MSRTIFNFSDLSNKLDGELGWRRKELQLINDLIPKKVSPLQTSLLRACVPILYSHWEGFVKIVTETYLKFVSNKYEKTSDLKTPFMVLSILKKINNYEISDFNQKVLLVDTLINDFDKPASIPTKNVIQTKSNLWFENFEEIIYIVGLDILNFKIYEEVINDLVESRNYIAHGHYLKIDFGTYFDMHNDIINAMRQLKTEIENSSVLFSYKDTNRFAV